MSGSIVRKKPAWLKARGSAPGAVASPSEDLTPSATSHDDMNEVNMFSRAAHIRTWAEDAARAQRDAGAAKIAKAAKAPVKDPASPKPVKRRKLGDQDTLREAGRRESPPHEQSGPRYDHSPGVSHSNPESVSPLPAKIQTSIETDDDHAPGVYDGVEVVSSTRSSPRNAKKWSPMEKGKQNAPEIKHPPASAKSKEPIILLDDDDDDTPPKDSAHQASDTDSSPGVDEDFDTIVRRAERRRAREQAEAKAQPVSPAGKAQAPLQSQHSQRPATPKARLKILVHSPIPDTQPMFGEVLLAQPLKLLRTTWCSRQPFDAEFAKGVFLTWRGLKIWDWTSCASLGVMVNPHGGVYWKVKGRAGFEDDANLEMEAMTTEIFEQQQEETRRRRYELPRDDGSDDVQIQAQATQQPAAENSSKIRIIIKAQGYEEYKLRVNPDTRIDKIVSAFFKMRDVPSEKHGFLMFDGDRLEGTAIMSETEVGDLDHLDLHIK